MQCKDIEKCAYDIERRENCRCDIGCIFKSGEDYRAYLDEEKLLNLAEFFSMFADSTRIKILNALLGSEKCVCEIADMINASQSAVSHQLRLLKQSKLVKFRRSGKSMIYSLADDHVRSILALGLTHIEE